MNIPTIIVLFIIAAIFLTIVVRGIIRRKRGESSCSCGCSGCGAAEFCHGRKAENNHE